MAELKNSIVKSNESAAGPDGVCYQFLRHLPESCLHILLKLLTNIWTTGDIPPSWREASVVPIPKPGKYPSNPPTIGLLRSKLLVHQGNENMDKLAKAALNKASYSGKLICLSDLKPKVNAYIHTVLQENWDTEEANKLHEVLSNMGEDLHKRGEGAGRKRETVQKRIHEFIKDGKQEKMNFEPMDKVFRAIVHDVAEVAGLTSFSFGEEEEDRYVMLWKKEFAPSDDELLAYRKGEEWNPEKAKELAMHKVCLRYSLQN
ncbi:sperm-associated antigen 7-like protein [Plakobranchus ocellatus]|uniref:Sperm-associated antigen 7-like protein n=1 Tax=Plakobranchus ocellatus TaxID=259542 RepID=A0AAV3ZY43_9GAST|nr:sperm-associated antigen 7-like protein [Plakobranchus ocellatus]